jgi:hypothetical protein
VRVNVVCTVDIDNDGVALYNERNALHWRALSMLPPLKQLFADHGAPVTWFVRADSQLADTYGDPAYLLHSHAPLWNGFTASGDEIGWHPHLYQRDRASGAYVPDRDAERCADTLTELHQALAAAGFGFDSVRLGEAFHGNATMRRLSALGLKVDSTAIPGRRRNDEQRVFDWEPTPNEPYHPAPGDYRVPGRAGSLPILEVPMTTVPIQAPYDPAPLKRYVNLAYHHALFQEGFTAHLLGLPPGSGGEAFVTTILHPEEVAAGAPSHPLYSFSLDGVGRNLDFMLEASARQGFAVRFLTMRAVPGCRAPESDG